MHAFDHTTDSSPSAAQRQSGLRLCGIRHTRGEGARLRHLVLPAQMRAAGLRDPAIGTTPGDLGEEEGEPVPGGQLGRYRQLCRTTNRLLAAHNIAGETHVVFPACFEAFVAGWNLAAATVRNRVVARLALGRGQPLSRRARRRQPGLGHGVSGGSCSGTTIRRPGRPPS